MVGSVLGTACSAGCLAALATAQDQRTCTPGCFGNGGDACSGDSCFFSDCACEFHGTVTSCVATSGCAGWRQTGGCSASGPREPSNDKACCDYVQMVPFPTPLPRRGHRLHFKLPTPLPGARYSLRLAIPPSLCLSHHSARPELQCGYPPFTAWGSLQCGKRGHFPIGPDS